MNTNLNNPHNQIRIDDNLANNIVDKIEYFKHIHPNTISTISHICNAIILYQLFFANIKNIEFIGLIIIIRYFTDILDGSVARKYNKTSELGHKLDHYGDNI